MCKNNLYILLVFLSVFRVAEKLAYFSMRTFPRLEDEQESGAICTSYFCTSPKELVRVKTTSVASPVSTKILCPTQVFLAMDTTSSENTLCTPCLLTRML